jgi:uncharacterized membrane-anchored protein YhcB (DUF1043 family)
MMTDFLTHLAAIAVGIIIGYVVRGWKERKYEDDY